MKKKLLTITLTTMGMLSLFLMLMVACKKKVVPNTPTGVSATVMGTYIRISWKAASNAEYYWITDKSGTTIGETSNLYYDDYNPKIGTNYYYVYSKNSYYTSLYAELVSCYYSGNNGGGGGGENNSPSAPTGVSANVNGTSIQVSWNSVSGASSYRVYRASSGSGPYSQIGTSSSTYYYDNNPLTNNYYKVTAIGSNGSESEKSSYAYCQYSGGGGGGGGGGTAPSAPTGVSARVNGSNIRVSWNSVSNADTYYVYWSEDDVSYSCYWATTDTYILDDQPYANNYYQVRAENDYGVSPFSSVAYCHYTGGSSPTPDAPTNVSANVSGTSVRVSWSSVSNASFYRIYRSSTRSRSYSLIGTSSSTYYYDNNPLPENYYKVTSVGSDGSESEMSSNAYCHYSGGGGGGTVPSAPTGVTAENMGTTLVPNVKISWNSVTNATSYKVYRSSTASGTYSQIGSSTSNTYLYDGSPMQGKNYYKVKAVNNAGESSYSSYAMFNYSTTAVEPCPPSVTVTGSSTCLTVKWTASTGFGCGTPTKYEVYKRDPFTSNMNLVTTTTSTSYKHYDVHPGYNRYAVKAVNNYGTSGAAYGTSPSITLSKPSSFTAQKYQSSYIRCNWSKVDKATGYQISLSTSASGTYVWEQIDNVNTTTKDIYYPANSGTTVYLKIRAIFIADYAGDPIYSDWTTYKTVTF